MHRRSYRGAALEASRPGRDDGYNGTAGLSPVLSGGEKRMGADVTSAASPRAGRNPVPAAGLRYSSSDVMRGALGHTRARPRR